MTLISKFNARTSDYYCKIEQMLSPEERMSIIKLLTNKDCTNCTNGICSVESYEKIGLDEFGKPQGHDCIGWYNSELIGRSRVLKLSDTLKLK